MQSYWPAQIKREFFKYFYDKNVGYIWDKKHDLDTGQYVTLDLIGPTFKQYSDHWKAVVSLKIIITSQDKTLYGSDNVLGEVLLALTDIPILDSCARRLTDIETDEFDWEHGRKQIMIQTSYQINLRG